MMQFKIGSLVFIAVLLASVLVFQMGATVNAQTTYLRLINPLTGDQQFNFTSNEKHVGDTFVVNITVVGVTNLYAWQVTVGWDPTMLNFSKISLPSDHVFAGQSFFPVGPIVESGSVLYGVSLGVGGNTFNGTGILAQLELRIAVQSSVPVSCNITFIGAPPVFPAETFLLDGRGADIAFTPEKAVFSYWPLPAKLMILPKTNTFYGNVTPPGSVFLLNVTVANVTNLFSWRVNITWDASMLNFSRAILPSDHVFAGQVIHATGPIASDRSVVYGNALDPGGNTFNGTVGTLFQLELKIITQSRFPVTCNITFERAPPYSPPDTFLRDRGGVDMLFEMENGTFTFLPPPSDIGITSLVPSTPGVNLSLPIPVKTVVGQGYNTTIYMTLRNQGVFTEYNVHVTVYWSNSTHVNQTIANVVVPQLPANNSLIVSLDWNTGSLAYGNYSISVYAEPVLGETNIQDNSYASTVQIHVGVPGDVTGTSAAVPDGRVDIRDITYVILKFQTTPQSPNWNPNADINNDGVVDIRDITFAILNFFKQE
jgi:hypothetical protein